MKNSKHILVTGGAGFIGSHLVERLLNDGKKVVVIDDLSTGSLENLLSVEKNPRLRIVQSKISACGELHGLVAGADFIFHLAATVGVELVVKSALHVLESSFHETQMLLQAAAKKSTPLLLTSTSEVYGKSAKAEFSEDDDLLIGSPNQSRWSYACSKLTDEFLALACRSSSRDCSTPSARARPGVTAWSCRASSRLQKRTSPSKFLATARNRAAFVSCRMSWNRSCVCRIAKRRATKFSTSAERRKFQFWNLQNLS
jgi:nucleoside-diphosphate-sugar epimerase